MKLHYVKIILCSLQLCVLDNVYKEKEKLIVCLRCWWDGRSRVQKK